MIRFPFLIVLLAALAGPAHAARTGPFALSAEPAASAERATILVIEDGSDCEAASAAAQAALARAAGRAVGVVAGDGEACAAAMRILQQPAATGPDLAFAAGAAAFGEAGEPNAWLAERRERGVYVWDLPAYRRLKLSGPRQVLGVFEPAGAQPAPSMAEMTDAAVEALSRNPGGYFLLVQASGLDEAAREAIERARRDGARVIASAP